MQSPKFFFKAEHLKAVVNAKRLEQLWTGAVRDKMRKQMLPDAVENLDFQVKRKQRCKEIEAAICNGEYTPRQVLRLLVEKSSGLCRQIVIPSPEDALVLQALADSLWQTIKDKQPSENAFYAQGHQGFKRKNIEGDEGVFGYGPIEAWLDFQRTILGFTKSFDYVVSTDLTNYYDFIIHAYLRYILSDLGIERETCLDLLLFVLDHMLWTPDYMPNFGIGLPQMNLDAPRLLAHTHLFEIDQLFCSRTDVGFARFMDDIDFGVNTVQDAKCVLRDLDLALQTRNLRVNRGKTKIMTSKAAYDHFRVEDNQKVDRLVKKLEDPTLSAERKKALGRVCSRIISWGLQKGHFEAGNGDKILKRLLLIAQGQGVSIEDNNLRTLLFEKPGLRDVAMLCWSRGGKVSNQLPIVVEFLASGHAVDDYAKPLAASTLATSFIQVRLGRALLESLVDCYDPKRPIELYGRLIILSRFTSLRLLLDEIDRHKDVWSRQRYLTRWIVALSPMFLNTSYFARYKAIVSRNAGPDAYTLIDFEEELVESKSIYSQVSKFLKAPNPSTGIGVSAPKAYMIMAIMNNRHIAKSVKTDLYKCHPKLDADYYYGKRFRRIWAAI